MVEKLPRSQVCYVIGNQLLRCSTSVGSNYRAACKGKSKADFIYKLGIAEEEADESIYWLELLIEAGVKKTGDVNDLIKEAGEITAILAASRKTAKKNKIEN